jgi:hypothetical protein
VPRAHWPGRRCGSSLFGSHAREDARAISDLDFLVIEQTVSDRHAEMVRLRSALHDLCRPIDVLVYSQAQVDEWGDAPVEVPHQETGQSINLTLFPLACPHSVRLLGVDRSRIPPARLQRLPGELVARLRGMQWSRR